MGSDVEETGLDEAAGRGGVWAFVRLMRLRQWSKSAFVLVGPVYALGDGTLTEVGPWAMAVLWTAVAFGLMSSGMYVFNDLADAAADRTHPRKKRRPIASGAIGAGSARVFGVGLIVAAVAVAVVGGGADRWWVVGLVAAHGLNVGLYTAVLKHRRIADVVSLAMGFVLRVVAGCAAAGIEPSTWLLNATFFLSMFLAFGKRLGERRTMGEELVAGAREVQRRYSVELLRMLVVVTAVATLLTYAQYVQERGEPYRVILWSAAEGVEGSGFAFNLMWLTVLPATFALLRALVMVETGVYDDPTELATKDPPFVVAGLCFVGLAGGLALWFGGG